MTDHDYQRLVRKNTARRRECCEARQRCRARLDLALDALLVAAIGLGILAVLMVAEWLIGWTMGR